MIIVISMIEFTRLWLLVQCNFWAYLACPCHYLPYATLLPEKNKFCLPFAEGRQLKNRRSSGAKRG